MNIRRDGRIVQDVLALADWNNPARRPSEKVWTDVSEQVAEVGRVIRQEGRARGWI